MAKVVTLSHKARFHLDEIIANVVEYTGSAISGKRLLEEFYEKFELIGFLPKSNKLLENGTREAFCRSYRIIYEELDDEVRILMIMHSRKKFP